MSLIIINYWNLMSFMNAYFKCLMEMVILQKSVYLLLCCDILVYCPCVLLKLLLPTILVKCGQIYTSLNIPSCFHAHICMERSKKMDYGLKK